MLFKTTALTFILASAQVLAAPAPTENGVVLIDTFEVADGTITVYGSDPASVTTNEASASEEESLDTPQLSKRCGSNRVSCFNSNKPALNTCRDLVNNVRGSSQVLSNSPRSICLTRSGQQCCISWSKDIGRVRESDLHSAASKTMNQCIPEGLSGKATDVNINNQCLTQCLSNRPNGCS